MPNDSLRERCRVFLERQYIQPAPLDAVDDLVAFVMAERMRAAVGPLVDDAFPLCVMFSTAADRDGFVETWREVHPQSRTIKTP